MIDWFTVIAQIVNFLILLALLKYFLYGRILAAMEKRQQDIASQWDDAQQQREQAAKEIDDARRKNRQLDEQREQMLATIRDEVETHRQELMVKVRFEVSEQQSRWSEAIQEETAAFLRDLRRRTSEEVGTIARRALHDLADVDLERQIVNHFLSKVRQLGEDEQVAVVASLREGNHAAVVQTTGELTDDLKHLITDTLRRCFLDDLEVRFEKSDDLLCGIALQTDAHKLAWDLRDYLGSLEHEVKQTLEEETAMRKSQREEAAKVGS